MARGVQGKGLAFVEFPRADSLGFERFFYRGEDQTFQREVVDIPTSRFGVSWEDISTTDDRKYWIAGSRLQVIDLVEKRVVAERTGFYIESGFGSRAGQRRPWQASKRPQTTCPDAHDLADSWFLFKVLKPAKEGAHGG